MHPLTQITNEIVEIFADLGFQVVLGPELESEEYNFDRLNFPKDHPARDMQDTFFIKDRPGYVLRTHTSNVQTRFMEALVQSGGKPPFAIIAPGKVFRNEATDATHEMQFHQVEGLMIGEQVNMSHLKGVLLDFFKKFLGPDSEIRLRPSFFPFVEPGVEVDVRVGDRWIEVLGAGMVHPHVLEAAGIDSKKYQGFAFGMGADRFLVMKYGVTDIRLSYQGDLRFNQF
ncbi:MAG: phenylalanine--tRNA ligase subunit alpha [bacterium]